MTLLLGSVYLRLIDLISVSTSRSRGRHSSRGTFPVLFTENQLKKEMDLFAKRYVYLD